MLIGSTFMLYSWKTDEFFLSVTYNNVYGRSITINISGKFNNRGFKKWLEIIASGDLLTKLRKSENGGLKSNANSGEEGDNKKTLSSEKASRISSFCRPKSTVTHQMRCAATRVLPWLQSPFSKYRILK